MLRSLLRVAILLAVSTALGVASARYHDLPWVPDVERVRQRLREEKRKQAAFEQLRRTVGLTLDELREQIARGAVIIDARDRDSFEEAHLAVPYEPPVLNIPPDDPLEAHLDRLMQLQGYPLVLYCNSETCDLAEELYLDLKKAGLLDLFAEVRIFFPGWAVLKETGLPKTRGPDEWRGFAAAQEPNLPTDAAKGTQPESAPAEAEGAP